MDILQKLKSKSPRCLLPFKLDDSESPNKSFIGEEFITKSISCGCENQSFHILGFKQEETSGFFFKKKVTIEIPPIYLKCEKCKSQSLIFNPVKHGWDGESDCCACFIGTGEPKLLVDSPSKVLVTYSYQNPDNYLALEEDGISNPEDYFDTFTLYNECNGKFVPLISCECA